MITAQSLSSAITCAHTHTHIHSQLYLEEEKQCFCQKTLYHNQSGMRMTCISNKVFFFWGGARLKGVYKPKMSPTQKIILFMLNEVSQCVHH